MSDTCTVTIAISGVTLRALRANALCRRDLFTLIAEDEVPGSLDQATCLAKADAAQARAAAYAAALDTRSS